MVSVLHVTQLKWYQANKCATMVICICLTMIISCIFFMRLTKTFILGFINTVIIVISRLLHDPILPSSLIFFLSYIGEPTETIVYSCLFYAPISSSHLFISPQQYDFAPNTVLKLLFPGSPMTSLSQKP